MNYSAGGSTGLVNSFYWLAINGSSCAMSPYPLPATLTVSPVPQLLLGFESEQEAREIQQFVLSAPMAAVREKLDQVAKEAQTGRIKVISPKRSEPPSSQTTSGLAQLASDLQLRKMSDRHSLTTTEEQNKFFEQFDPEFWRICCPRIYEEPRCGRYSSPKAPARMLASATFRISKHPSFEHTPFVGDEITELREFDVASRLAAFGTPTYWIAESMASALRQTAPPMEIDWHNMQLPYEACVFMMPKGSLSHPEYGEAEFVAYARRRS